MKARDRRRVRRDKIAVPDAALAVPTENSAAAVTAKPAYETPADLSLEQSQNVATWILCAYLVVIVAGYFLLITDWAAPPGGHPLNKDKAFFMAVNAATLTGFQQAATTYGDTLTGPLILMTLTWVGAMVSLVVGGMAAVRILGLKYSDRQVAIYSVVWLFGATIVGMVFLLVIDPWPVGISGGRHFFDELFLSLSAFGNSGLYSSAKAPGGVSLGVQVVVLPLCVLGSLGLPVMLDLGRLMMKRKPLSDYSWMILSVNAMVYLAAVVVLIVLIEFPAHDSQPFWKHWVAASNMAIDARTAGFSFDSKYLDDLPRTAQWVLLIFMAIGGSPAGTAGGMKVTVVSELVKGTTRSLRSEPVTRIFGMAISWLGIYAGMVLVGFLAMIMTATEYAPDRALIETVSAISNVGLSVNTVILSPSGLFTLSAEMLFGRLAPMLILWWMAASVSGADTVIG